jgi:hypothetical protein
MKKQFVLVIACISLAAPAWARRHKEDPAVAVIHKLYVKGNNEAASNMRKILGGKTGRLDNLMSGHGNQGGCFQLVGNETAADGVLEVAEERTSGGVEKLFGSNNASTVVSATLSDRQGNLVWSDSKQGMSGLVHTGSGDGARNLAFALQRAAGCK